MKDEEKIRNTCRHLAIQLKTRREQLGISANRLAEMSGLNRQTVTFVERGDRIPSLSTFLRLARALGLTPSEMWKLTEDNSQKKAED